MRNHLKVLAAIMLMTAVVFAGGCKPEVAPETEPTNQGGNNNGGNDEVVTVVTYTPEDITSTSVVCGGAVSVIEGVTLDEVGVCWGTNATLTVAGTHLSTESFITLADDHDYVDLGLPSGTLWATCNVGANAPEEYGDYFAWGETMPKTTYNWSTYKYCNGDADQLTKYCNDECFGYNGFFDNLTVLQSTDDAATANWGNGWCTPTREQWKELYENTTGQWTTQNGVTGRLFIATNGNSLFLPAAGSCWDDVLEHVGIEGHYWSSSLSVDHTYRAWGFYDSSVNYSVNVASHRYFGLSVRPVRSARQN